jgi:hypothetical protein
MKKRILPLLGFISLLITILQPSFAENRWAVGEKALTLNGNPVFLNGVNYVPPVNWHTSYEDWNPEELQADLIALKKIGVKCVRMFPLWPILQPEPGRVDPVRLERVVQFLDMAQKAGIFVQPAPITGWMSGFTFLPKWADGNVFTDPKIVESQKILVRTLAERLRNHPALCSYDFGNEINCLIQFMKLDVTPETIDRWMGEIYKAFKSGDPNTLVTNGIGTGYDPYFNIRSIAKSADFMSPHSYPYFHRTILLDPYIGQRSSYSINYITSWAAMTGKPALMQETGETEYSITPQDIVRYLRITYSSAWAEGAAGYFWWCSHDIRPDYQIGIDGLFLKYSLPGQDDRRLSRFEQKMGLLTVGNQEKPVAKEYRRLTELFDRLGLGWNDIRPVFYILTPDNDEYFNTMLELVNPFTLLKQNHADVKFLRDGSPVPGDAAGLVIPCAAVSERGKPMIRTYLENGGTVYQSFYNDFADSVRLTGVDKPAQSPRIWIAQGKGQLSGNRFILLRASTIREIRIGKGVAAIAMLCTGSEKVTDWDFGIPFYVRTKIGKGDYLFLPADMEKALTSTYNPWKEDTSDLIYKALMPESEIEVDNKFVEFYHKTRGDEEMLVLINHSEEFQDVILRSAKPLTLTDHETGQVVGSSRMSLSLRMEPAAAMFLDVR